MCHVSHLTDALLGMVALSLAVCVTARSSIGVVCVYTTAKSCLCSFPISLSKGITVRHSSKDNKAKFQAVNQDRSVPSGRRCFEVIGSDLKGNILFKTLRIIVVPQI